MQFKTNPPSKGSGWRALFLPEDTTSQCAAPSDGRRVDAFGSIKCWLWIAISIALSLAVGQL